MDNVTAVTYINKIGGTHSRPLSQLAKNLWDWFLSHNVLLSAQYIPGIQNIQADRESRVFLDSSGLETEPNCFQQPASEIGTSGHRPFRIPPDISIRPLCELETRPFGNTYGCVHPQLGDILWLCIFPIRNDRSVPSTNSEPEDRAPCAGGTSLANPSLVSPFTGTLHRFPSSTANSGRSVDPEGQEPPSSSTSASWVATINSGYQTKGISDQTRNSRGNLEKKHH